MNAIAKLLKTCRTIHRLFSFSIELKSGQNVGIVCVIAQA